jgi:hypothetical protein
MRPFRRFTPSFLVFFLLCPAALRAQVPAAPTDHWNNDVREIAGKIAAAAAPARSVSINVKNLSSLDSSDATAIGDQLRAELIRNAFSIGSADSADVAITLTLSEGAEGYVWVAELRTRTGSKVVMTSPNILPKTTDSAARQSIILNEVVVTSSADPVLDFSFPSAPDGRSLLLLVHPDRLELLERYPDSWAPLGSAAIQHSHPWPRDLRARIHTPSSEQFQVYFPGVSCAGATVPSLFVKCREADKLTWPASEPVKSSSLLSDRNYFVSLDSLLDRSATNPTAFYSFAAGTPEGRAQAILAGIGGNVHLITENGSGANLPLNWGDDLASLSVPCSANWFIVASASGDWTQADRLQIFSVNSAGASPAGQSLNLSGPVLALWPSPDGKSLRVVSRNLETGMYEASIVSASCGN